MSVPVNAKTFRLHVPPLMPRENSLSSGSSSYLLGNHQPKSTTSFHCPANLPFDPCLSGEESDAFCPLPSVRSTIFSTFKKFFPVCLWRVRSPSPPLTFNPEDCATGFPVEFPFLFNSSYLSGPFEESHFLVVAERMCSFRP